MYSVGFYSIGALKIRIGLGVYYTIILTRSPQPFARLWVPACLSRDGWRCFRDRGLSSKDITSLGKVLHIRCICGLQVDGCNRLVRTAQRTGLAVPSSGMRRCCKGLLAQSHNSVRYIARSMSTTFVLFCSQYHFAGESSE